MNDDASRTFRTHHGTCTVTPTRLILRKDADSEDDDWVDTMTTQSAKPGGPYHRLNIILSAAFIVVGVIFAIMGDIFVALCAIGGGVLFFLIVRRENVLRAGFEGALRDRLAAGRIVHRDDVRVRRAVDPLEQGHDFPHHVWQARRVILRA